MENPSHPAKRNILATIFLSPSEPRLRAGWRFLLQTILLFIIAVIIVVPLSPFFTTTNKITAMLVDQTVNLLVMTGSIYIARHWLDKRSFESLGLKLDARTLLDVLVGIGIAALLMGTIFLAFLALGWSTFDGFAWQTDSPVTVLTEVLVMLFVFILVGWNEELLARGYHLQTLASGLNMVWGVLISSAIFGTMHLGNPNATWVSAAGIFFGGIFLAYGYIRTRQLWLPIGLHIGWNFFEGVVFGFPVSGLDIYPLLRQTIHGPELWTGGAFGPEAGLIILPALALGMVLIRLYTEKQAAGQ